MTVLPGSPGPGDRAEGSDRGDGGRGTVGSLRRGLSVTGEGAARRAGAIPPPLRPRQGGVPFLGNGTHHPTAVFLLAGADVALPKTPLAGRAVPGLRPGHASARR